MSEKKVLAANSHILRNWAIGIGLFLALAAANRYFGWLRMPWSRPQAVELLPSDCGLAFGTVNPSGLADSIDALPYLESLRSIGFFDDYLSDLVELDSFFVRAGSSAWSEGRCRLISGLMPHGANEYRWVHIVETPENIGAERLVAAWPGKKREYAYRNRRVHELREGDVLRFGLAEYRGLLVFSRQSLFVERALSQGIELRSGFRSTSGFRDVWNRTGQGQLTLFLQMGQLARTMSVFCPPEKKDVQDLGSVFSWVGLDLFFSSSGIACNGVATSPEGWLTQSILRGSASEEPPMADILPDNTAVWLYAALKPSATRNPSEAFKAHVRPWMGDERGYAITEPGSADIASYAFVVLKAQDPNAALQALDAAADQFGAEPPVKHVNYQLRRVLSPDLLKGVFPESLVPVENPYYAAVGNYLVFANSLDGLRWWIDKNTLNLTLRRSDRYLRMRTALAGKGQGFWYFSPEHAYHLLKRYFRPEMEAAFDQAYPLASQLGPMGFLLQGQGQRFSLQGQAVYSGRRATGSSISWRVPLGTPAVVAPQAFRTAKSGRVDILVQDADHRLYCIGADGVVRWNRLLDSRMFPGVQATDYYGNGDQQYYLNTQKFIYLLDSTGNDVFKPLEVPGEACTGVLLDKPGEKGRLFVGCSNGQVYGYYPNGAALEGWSPYPAAGVLAVAPAAMTHDGKSYIALLSKEGRLTLAERNGKTRFSKELSPAFSAYIGVDGEIGRLVAANAEGVVEAFNMTGESFRLTPKAGKNEGVRFLFSDVTADKRKDYVLLSQQHFAVHGYKDKKFVEFGKGKFPKSQTTVFAVAPPGGGKSLIGTVNLPQREVMLLDADFKPFAGFPMPGSTRFALVDLFGDQGMAMVVAEGATVYACKLR